MPAKTPGESAKREAAIIAPPSPAPPISISVTIATIIDTGSATCSPVRICGNAAGRMISHKSRRSPAPRLRADHSISFSTPWVLATVAVTTGKIALNTIIVILETS